MTCVDALLSRLQKLNPKQAASFNAEDGCVVGWRRVVSRRKDGTIRGFYENGGGDNWEKYPIPLADAVAHHEKTLRANLKTWRQNLERTNRVIVEFQQKIAECKQTIEYFSSPEGDLPETVRDYMLVAERKKLVSREETLSGHLSGREDLRRWISDAEAKL